MSFDDANGADSSGTIPGLRDRTAIDYLSDVPTALGTGLSASFDGASGAFFSSNPDTPNYPVLGLLQETTVATWIRSLGPGLGTIHSSITNPAFREAGGWEWTVDGDSGDLRIRFADNDPLSDVTAPGALDSA